MPSHWAVSFGLKNSCPVLCDLSEGFSRSIVILNLLFLGRSLRAERPDDVARVVVALGSAPSHLPPWYRWRYPLPAPSRLGLGPVVLRLVKYPVMACQRYWSYGATELFRLRHTATLGYLRLEAESMALVVLFLQDDALAHRWANITKESAHQFFRDTQPRVKAVLKQFDLNNTYDIASGSSQHVRMAGLVRSMMSSKPGQLSLPDQEFNLDDPYSFHLGIAHFHRIQSRIFSALGSVIPDARTDEWVKQETAFADNAAELWKVLEQRYAKNIQEQAMGDRA